MQKDAPVRPTKLTPTRYENSAPLRASRKSMRCPVELTLEVIGGKWKVVILRHLINHRRPLRFAELMKLLPSISQRMLTRQLRELESYGIIFRDVYPVVPPRVEYGVTERGHSLNAVLVTMCEWGRANGWQG